MVTKMTQTYDPDWNPDSYDMTLKYKPMDLSTVNDILTQYKDDPVLDYIKDLYKLIDYQSKVIWEQRKEIIAVKHKEAWKRYDKPEEDYDPSTRKFVDKHQR
jgi:hypothetical protein